MHEGDGGTGTAAFQGRPHGGRIGLHPASGFCCSVHALDGHVRTVGDVSDISSCSVSSCGMCIVKHPNLKEPLKTDFRNVKLVSASMAGVRFAWKPSLYRRLRASFTVDRVG